MPIGHFKDPFPRFLARISKSPEPDGCWEWTGAPHGDGYGEFWLNGKREKAHVAAFILSRGRRPKGVVRHRCDNPPCVRFSHVIDGTQAQNVQDMISRGRAAPPPILFGEDNPSAKLSWDDVRTIRLMKNVGVRNQDLATMYLVSHSTVRRIVAGESWPEVVAPGQLAA